MSGDKWQEYNMLTNKKIEKLLINSEGGLSLDLEPADKEPKNQNWLF